MAILVAVAAAGNHADAATHHAAALAITSSAAPVWSHRRWGCCSDQHSGSRLRCRAYAAA
jgi:hypothetical protein